MSGADAADPKVSFQSSQSGPNYCPSADYCPKRSSTAAGVDLITLFACVFFWCGTWSCFDHFEVNETFWGVLSALLAIVLAGAGVEKRLNRATAKWGNSTAAIAVYVWTIFLAVLSLSIWRMLFFLVHTWILPPNDDLRASGVLVLGVIGCLLCGCLRAAADAPPVCFVHDPIEVDERFAPASSCVKSPLTASLWLGSVLDLLLTIPVVLVWAGLWMLLDNHEVHLEMSLLVSFLTVAAVGGCDAGRRLRDATAKLPGAMIHCAEVLWTCLLVLLVVVCWRGVWEIIGASWCLPGLGADFGGLCAGMHLGLTSRPVAAVAISVLGSIVLALLGRQRSTLFPPMDFSWDAEPHFAPTGVEKHVAHLHAEDFRKTQELPSGDYGATCKA